MKKKQGFTLLELIVVIVILGILATLGFSQYTKMVERQRQGEVVVNFGKMRQLAIAYYLQNGTLATVTAADLGIGSGGIPDSCVSTNYYCYSFQAPTVNSVCFYAIRCRAGGKEPQWTGNDFVQENWFSIASGDDIRAYDYVTTQWHSGWWTP